MKCRTQNCKIDLRQALPFWAVLGAVCLVCALPYLNSDLAAGHDALFHLLRIEALADAIKGGAGWPVRVYSLICGGYGYAAGLFYPDVFLLFPAILRAFVLGPELSFKAYLLLCCAETCVACYYCGKNIGKSRLCGLLLMIGYGLCHYHLANLFIRSAVGEVQAMVFVPLVVWGLYDLTEEDFSRPWVLCLAFTGLMLSHTISLALCGIFALCWVLVRLPRVLLGRTVLRGLLAVAVCLGLSCFYWLPLLEQFASATFKVSGEPLTHLQENTVTASLFFDRSDFRSPGVSGFVLLAVGVVMVVLLWRRGEKFARMARFGAAMLAVSLVLTLCTLKGVLPWAALDKTPLAAIQFPWRLNMLGQFCLTLAVSVLASAWMRLDGKKAAAMTAAVGVFVISAANAAFLWGQLPELCNYPENYFEQRGETFYLVGQEWLPLGTNLQEFAAEPDAQYTDAAGAHTGLYLPDGSFIFADDGAPGLRGIPKIYYKGYTAWKTLKDGSQFALELHADGANRVEVVVPEGLGEGEITVAYTGTVAQTLSGWVSAATLLALAGLAVCGVFGRVKKSKMQKE